MAYKEYKCSWIDIKRCRDMRKRLLKEFQDKEKLFKFAAENKISHKSTISEKFDIPHPHDWEYAQRYSVRFFNLCFALKAGVPLYEFESIPEAGRRRKKYLHDLFFYLNTLIEPLPWNKQWQERIKFFISLSQEKMSMQDLIEWLTNSGITYRELEEVSRYDSNSQVCRFIKLTKKKLEQCKLQF